MGYFSDMALHGTIGEAREDGVTRQVSRVGTAAERRAAMLRREAERREHIARLASDGRLCGHCRQFEAREDGLCNSCINLRRDLAELKARGRGEAAAYRAQATERGIVVGAAVARKYGRGRGTVVEVGGNFVRVAWHDSWGAAGWGRGGTDHRTCIKALAALVVVGR